MDKFKTAMNTAMDTAGKWVDATKPLASAAAQDAAAQDATEKATQVAAWWSKYRSDNPSADAAFTKVGAALDDIQLRLEVISRNVTGEAALAEANNLLDKQRRYNDILATRLAEALDRIDELEKRLAVVEAKK